MEFHTAIAAISGNPIFAAVSESMLGWLKRFHTELLLWSGKETFTLAEHGAIVAMIEKRDPDAAEEAMAYHLNSLGRALQPPGLKAGIIEPLHAEPGRRPESKHEPCVVRLRRFAARSGRRCG